MRSSSLVRLTSFTAAMLSTGMAHAGFNIGPIQIGGFVGDVGAPVANVVTQVSQGIGRAGEAAGGAVVDTAKGVGSAVQKVGERLSEGKPIDAVLTFQLDLYRGQEQAALTAMQKSPELRVGTQMLVTAYTGPMGTAAFNGWFVGRSTDSLENGFRAAVITGATGVLQGGIADSTSFNALGRAVASAGVGGFASQASGGTFEEGAIGSGLASLGQSAYRAYTWAPIDGQAGGAAVSKVDGLRASPEQIAACAKRVGECFVIRTAVDMRKVPYRANNIGRFYDAAHDGPRQLVQEGSSFMQGVNQVPYMNAMSFIHDVAAVDADWTSMLALAGTIPPAMAFTYYASGSDRDAHLLDRQTEDSKMRASAK